MGLSKNSSSLNSVSFIDNLIQRFTPQPLPASASAPAPAPPHARLRQPQPRSHNASSSPSLLNIHAPLRSSSSSSLSATSAAAATSSRQSHIQSAVLVESPSAPSRYRQPLQVTLPFHQNIPTSPLHFLCVFLVQHAYLNILFLRLPMSSAHLNPRPSENTIRPHAPAANTRLEAHQTVFVSVHDTEWYHRPPQHPQALKAACPIIIIIVI
jgi:hypothetical protein